MFLTLRADKDAYITNRIINGNSQTDGNVGAAGSLDLFKLYGLTSSGSVPNIELSRLLIHFDLTPLRTAVSSGRIDLTGSSFSCRLHLFDVYGGQPTPNNFSVAVNALSASFDEGLGRDVVFYSDSDVCNWNSGSYASGSWFVSGCGLVGNSTASFDYYGNISAASSQAFITGEEDLDVDVTAAVQAAIIGVIPDSGFRIALSPSLESDQHTYFVKRFASRTAFNSDLHPALYVRFDDSIQDDTNNAALDQNNELFMYNYVRSTLANLMSASSPVTGIDCLSLRFIGDFPQAAMTSSTYVSPTFPVSQLMFGAASQVGIYSASVMLSSNDPNLLPQWQTSGSVKLTPVWGSLDGTVAYLTGSEITFNVPQRGPQAMVPKHFEVTVLGIRDSFFPTEQTFLRVNIFDYTQSYLVTVNRLPVELPGIVVRDVFYQIRDSVTGRIAIPFDMVTNSTRVSNDNKGMYFKLDCSNLTPQHTYVVDIMVVTEDNTQFYKAASPAFRVDVAP